MLIEIDENQVEKFESLGYTVLKTFQVDIPEAPLQYAPDDKTTVTRKHTRPTVSTNTLVRFTDLSPAQIPSDALRQFYSLMGDMFQSRNYDPVRRGTLNELMQPYYEDKTLSSISSMVSQIINYGGLTTVEPNIVDGGQVTLSPPATSPEDLFRLNDNQGDGQAAA